jgi:serine phosphatase RsbU (regulator of sigma subunit)/PAS domain-containing protein
LSSSSASRRQWVAIGLAIASALALLDILASGEAILIGLLVVAPLVTSVGASPRGTAVVAIHAVGLAVLLGFVNDIFGTVDHLLRMAVVAAGGGLGFWIAILREGAEHERERLAFLAEAGQRLDTSLDYGTAAQTLASLAVPVLGDWCGVYTMENGSIRQLAIAHKDPGRRRFATELDRRYPFRADMPIGVPKVIRTGEPELVTEIAESAIEAAAYDAEHARLLRQMTLRSAITVPMRARGRMIGALMVATAESGRKLGGGDLQLVQTLGRRAALAIDNARLYTEVREKEAELRRSAEEVEAILRGVASGITVQDTSGRLVFANEIAAKMLRASSADSLMETPPEQIMERFQIFDEELQPMSVEQLPGRLAMKGDRPPDAVVRFKDNATGETHWSVVKATPILDEEGNVSLVVNIFDDISAQKREELTERLLSESSRLLSASLEYETTLDNIAHLAVPAFADWCTVELLDEQGQIKLVALAHADPSKIEVAERMRTLYPTDQSEARGVPAVIRSGQPELYGEVSDELLAASAKDEQHMIMLQQIGMRSVIVAPMSVGGRRLGAMSFVISEPGRRFDEHDVRVAVELARRAATAVENARLYAERSHIARTLQRSLLPPVLPDIPGVEVAARFRPAGEGYDVGGDFYDVFNTGAGWGVVIGDVCGKGPEAAALTGLARHTLRAAAMQEHAPSRILTILSEAIRREHPDSQFCTAAYGRLELAPVGAKLTIASGGHPLPFLVSDSGSVRQVGMPGALLGSFVDVEVTDESLELQPGTALVLYTDGVIEAGNPRGAFGAEGLRALLETCAGLSASEIAERIDTAVTGLEHDVSDDVAVLVLRVRE